MKARLKNNRGSILIVVLGILVILSLLATVFASIQQMERDVARNHVDDVRARLVATSGVEHGIEQMKQTLDFGISGFMSKNWRYYGNDLAEVGDPALMGVSLEEAKSPSFALEVDEDPLNADPTPIQIVVNGKEIGITSFHETGTYGIHGDFYSVRVRDLQGSIHINDGVGQAGTSDTNNDGAIDDKDSSVSQNLRRILNNLGANSDVGVSNLGDKIISDRPFNGYQYLKELDPILGTDDYEKVERFLTAYAWVDPNVANPVPLSKDVKYQYPVEYYRGADIFRYGRGKSSTGSTLSYPLKFTSSISSSTNYAIWGMDELNPQWIELVSRAPVNVNAAEKEVLVALLDGLQGFFLLERRANNLAGWQSVYQWLNEGHNFAAGGNDKDELGYLYKTIPIVGPGSASTTGQTISANAIAEHIIACRNKTSTAGVSPGFDYSTVWFGGPFGSWKQFNQFCDNLLTIGLLKDNRNFVDYSTYGTNQSLVQQEKASQAIVDVLKANFNPNLHLNELNPDENMWSFVDKTDLITHSTEFVFLPCGYYEVEAIGYVVRPIGAYDDVLLASDNQIIATKRVATVVRLFEVFRHSSQKDFSGGKISARASYPVSNNNRTLEIGPEPDQGNVPTENEWSGYLALSTSGGLGINKIPKSVMSTPAGPKEMDEAFHGHFSLDFKLHYHCNNIREDLAKFSQPGEYVANLPDRTETLPGPYTPTMGGGNLYRLARSFRMNTGSTTGPALNYRAPLDLRIDGGYSERNSASAYWLSQQAIGSYIGVSQGAIAMWMKPNYFPGMSGKPRMNLSMDRYHGGYYTWYCNPSPFMLLYTATHDMPSYQSSLSENGNPYYNYGSPFGVLGMRPMSLGWGYGYSGATGYSGAGGYTIAEGGTLTPTLNHLTHPDNASKPSPMQAHKWMHVVLTWKTSDKNACKIYVNGVYMPGTSPVWYSNYKWNSSVDWSKHGDGTRNTVRMGAVSRYRNTSSWGYDRNWPADATLDELYFWPKFNGYQAGISLWEDGRYRKPNSNQEAYFLSEKIDLTAGQRTLPPPSTVLPPMSTGTGSSSTGTITSTASPKVRLLGASWTWYAETVDPSTGEPLLFDSTTSGYLHPKVAITILDGGTETTPLMDDKYSPIAQANGQPLELTGDFQYRVRFSIPDQNFDTILLATPVFDDLTIFYQTSQSMFVRYVME